MRPLLHQFTDADLYRLALTHRSAANPNNERLEFLGDAVLGYIIAEYLVVNFPDANEGELTRTRASLVNKRSLAAVARKIDLGSELVLGEGELKSGGWRRDSILANTLEALIGAIYLDGGVDACREQVHAWYAEIFAQVDPKLELKDPKTRLQEYLQARGEPLPSYETVDINGPAHDQQFTIRCEVAPLNEAVIASGNTRRRAEQKAARIALENLGVDSS